MCCSGRRHRRAQGHPRVCSAATTFPKIAAESVPEFGCPFLCDFAQRVFC